MARDHDRDGIHPCEVLSVLVLFVCAIGGLIFGKPSQGNCLFFLLILRQP